MEIPTKEDFERLGAQVDELKAMLQIVMERGMDIPKVVKVTDICRIEGVSRTQICGKEAYLLPQFGVSEYPDGMKRWKVETYLRWRRLPISERKQAYIQHLEAKRKKASATE